MGTLARLLRVIWARWADYNNFIAILDLFDWKTGLIGIISVVAMTFFGAANPAWSPQGVVVAAFVVGACVSLIAIAVSYFYRRTLQKVDQRRTTRTGIIEESPLEIIFDSANPGNRFWSIEPMRDENGNQIAGSFWEYRAVIKNKSARTVKNVKVTVEAIGFMPTRPMHSQFDINKKHFIDLTPSEETLAVIRTWFNPPLVQGMVIGEGAYGPIKMTASADDVLPTTKVFQFDPMQTPMIWIFDVKPSTP